MFNDTELPARYRGEDFRAMASKMQMIFQDPYSSLNPRMTVGEIISEGLRLRKALKPAAVQQKVADWLRMVGLSPDHQSRYPHEFSGGQRQRIGIARALILEPEFVVCDEPISALDVSVQAQVVNLLGDLTKELGLTLLFIAHDLSMVRYISDRMAVMYLGSLVEVGASNQVFFNPKHPYTETLIAPTPRPTRNTSVSVPPQPFRAKSLRPSTIPAGCPFANRCPKAMDHCASHTPLLKPLAGAGEQRLVACHLYD